MPLAISALQKQIKKYLEVCSGVMVQEVRVFVDSIIPTDEKTEASPYAIPTALLGLDADPLPVGKPEKQDEPEPQTEEQQGAEAECGVEPEADEPETKADDTAEEAAQEAFIRWSERAARRFRPSCPIRPRSGSARNRRSSVAAPSKASPGRRRRTTPPRPERSCRS